MPWVPGSHGSPSFYSEPSHISGAAFGGSGVRFLLERRKDLIRFRDEMVSFQKMCGKADRDGARFFGREAAEALKHYRACCHILSLAMRGPPGDCVGVQAGLEIAPYVDHAFALADLDACPFPLDAAAPLE